ncbi:MAG: hypothetical protein ACRDRI_19325 [Pseudonocardiaceae bacterium]
MTVLESLKLRMVGAASTRLQALVARRAEKLVAELLVSGASLWRDEQYHRWNEHELSCSVRLFYFCDRVLQENQDAWPLVRIEYDSAQPTRKMLSGDEDPSRAPRPDFTILFGDAKIRIEAKRLRPSGGFPALYVRHGMARFIDGRYSSTPPHPGVMIGYVEDGDPEAIVNQINSVVRAETTFGQTHVLSPLGDPMAAFVLPFHSVHGNGLRLLHFEVNLQGA